MILLKKKKLLIVAFFYFTPSLPLRRDAHKTKQQIETRTESDECRKLHLKAQVSCLSMTITFLHQTFHSPGSVFGLTTENALLACFPESENESEVELSSFLNSILSLLKSPFGSFDDESVGLRSHFGNDRSWMMPLLTGTEGCPAMVALLILLLVLLLLLLLVLLLLLTRALLADCACKPSNPDMLWLSWLGGQLCNLANSFWYASKDNRSSSALPTPGPLSRPKNGGNIKL